MATALAVVTCVISIILTVAAVAAMFAVLCFDTLSQPSPLFMPHLGERGGKRTSTADEQLNAEEDMMVGKV